MTVKRALITGITGQDGSYLAEFLLAKGYEVIGMIRRSSTINFERISHIQDHLVLVSGDLLDQASMIDLLQRHRPRSIQPGCSIVRSNFMVAAGIHRGSNRAGGHAFAGCYSCSRSGHSFLSSQHQRDVRQGSRDTAIRDNTLLSPQPLWGGESLWSLDHSQLPGSYSLFATSGIAFNHESPRRGHEFVTRKIARTAARIKLGLDHSLPLGNL